MSRAGYATDADLGIEPGRDEREEAFWDAHMYEGRRVKAQPWPARAARTPATTRGATDQRSSTDDDAANP